MLFRLFKEESQQHLTEFLKKVRNDAAFQTDVVFLAIDHSNSSYVFFPTHQQVLAAASPYLAQLLQGNPNEVDIHLSLPDFRHDILRVVLDYIYTGEVHLCQNLKEDFDSCLKQLGILFLSDCSNSVTVAGESEEILSILSEMSAEELSSEEPASKSEFFCNICEISFQNKKQLTVHLRTHSADRPYVCPVCKKSFRHLNVLRTHSRVHTGEKPFSCSICSRAFSHKSTLNEHMNLHSDDRPYACDVCHRRFKQRKSLRAHRCENSEEEVFQCEVCGRHFLNRKALALHRIHHETDKKSKEPVEKPFLCDICARGFSNKYLLKAHQMTHVSSDEKRFECQVCHKKFALKKTLQVHEASHQTENKGHPYQCSFCSKSFRYVANLDAHERIHTGLKPFDCPSCDMAFRQNSSLKEHMLTQHELKPEDRPFSCDICNRTFQARRQFVAHRYSHTKQTQRCPICKKRFYNAEKLAAHVSEHELTPAEDHQTTDPLGKNSTVMAHVNEDGELIITQDVVSDMNEETLIFTPSLLHVIHQETSEEVMNGGIVSVEGQDEGRQWSLEVVIDPQN